MRQARYAYAAVLWFAPVQTVSAQEGDGVYGRFDADTVASAAAVGGVALGDGTQPLGTLELRLRYLDTAGVLVAPEWRGEHGARITVGVELRPLFPGRMLMDRAHGVPFLDQMLDSFALDLGATVGPFGDGTGVALLVGLGFDLPIAIRRGRGLFLHLAARALLGERADLQGPSESFAEWNILAGFGVRTTMNLGLARREGPRFEPQRLVTVRAFRATR